jgi:UDP-N-acetylglucosamine 2-epimerase (non-hydrolysing)
MVDSLYYALPKVRSRSTLADRGLRRDRFGLVTLHRPALVDDPDRLRDVAETLTEIGAQLPLIFPVHPRTRQMMQRSGLEIDPRRVQVVDPLDYLDFLAMEEGAALVLTDSGGVQEETSVFGVPCLTLRENTERPITITRGTNTLVGFDRAAIVAAAQQAIARGRQRADIPLWDGHACDRIADIMRRPLAAPAFIPPSLAAAGSPEFLAGRDTLATTLKA